MGQIPRWGPFFSLSFDLMVFKHVKGFSFSIFIIIITIIIVIIIVIVIVPIITVTVIMIIIMLMLELSPSRRSGLAYLPSRGTAGGPIAAGRNDLIKIKKD